jgi:hypothetical protein
MPTSPKNRDQPPHPQPTRTICTCVLTDAIPSPPSPSLPSPPGLYLHEYLDALFTLGSPSSLPFHHLQPSLYATHAPHRLLAFLRGSKAYSPDQALGVGQRAGDVDAQAFLLCEMGRHEQVRGEGVAI